MIPAAFIFVSLRRSIIIKHIVANLERQRLIAAASAAVERQDCHIRLRDTLAARNPAVECLCNRIDGPIELHGKIRFAEMDASWIVSGGGHHFLCAGNSILLIL